MWGTIAQILIGAAVAVAADQVVKQKTGKHIHQHAYRWWSRLRDAVSNWIAQNPNTPVRRFVARLLHIVDSGITAVVRLTAETRRGEDVVVTTERMPVHELQKKFPSLKKSRDEMTYRH